MSEIVEGRQARCGTEYLLGLDSAFIAVSRTSLTANLPTAEIHYLFLGFHRNDIKKEREGSAKH